MGSFCRSVAIWSVGLRSYAVDAYGVIQDRIKTAHAREDGKLLFEARGFSRVICLTNAHNQARVQHKSADQVKPNFGIQFVHNLSRQATGFLFRFQRRNRQAIFPVLCPKPNLILPRPGAGDINFTVAASSGAADLGLCRTKSKASARPALAQLPPPPGQPLDHAKSATRDNLRWIIFLQPAAAR